MKPKTNEVKTCVWIKFSTHSRLKKVAADHGMKIQSAADQALIRGLDFFEGKAKHGN